MASLQQIGEAQKKKSQKQDDGLRDGARSVVSANSVQRSSASKQSGKSMAVRKLLSFGNDSARKS